MLGITIITTQSMVSDADIVTIGVLQYNLQHEHFGLCIRAVDTINIRS